MIFPPLCLTCDSDLNKDETGVCQKCVAGVAVNDYRLCPVCLTRIAERHHCHQAVGYSLVAATDYEEEVIKKIIWQLKYQGWQSMANPLAKLMTKSLRQSGIMEGSDWLMVPMPLHKSRQRNRGFNQSELLAELVALEMSLVWNNEGLKRIRNTMPQAEMIDWTDREKNIGGAFHIEKPELFQGRRIILVDDVFTSGATLREAARVLRLAGAKQVVALVVAKAR